jgi:hypothetical protein
MWSRADPKARADAADLVSGMKMGTLDAVTQKRIAQPWLYLRDHAWFPKALVTMQKPDGVRLFNGTHRMAAFNLIEELLKTEFDKINKRKAPLKQAVCMGGSAQCGRSAAHMNGTSHHSKTSQEPPMRACHNDLDSLAPLRGAARYHQIEKHP